ncbi:MAG TPA: hypothetical protein PLU73_10960 [Bacteroidia bacterium]|nr:hypothetical protein [Bacteroidia bacterium]
MIILNIVVSEKKAGEELVKFLLLNKYAISIQIDEEKQYVVGSSSVVEKNESFKISFITKALLYKEIEVKVYELLEKKLKMIYSIPVSQMNEEYAETLRDKIKKT